MRVEHSSLYSFGTSESITSQPYANQQLEKNVVADNLEKCVVLRSLIKKLGKAPISTLLQAKNQKFLNLMMEQNITTVFMAFIYSREDRELYSDANLNGQEMESTKLRYQIR